MPGLLRFSFFLLGQSRFHETFRNRLCARLVLRFMLMRVGAQGLIATLRYLTAPASASVSFFLNSLKLVVRMCNISFALSLVGSVIKTRRGGSHLGIDEAVRINREQLLVGRMSDLLDALCATSRWIGFYYFCRHGNSVGLLEEVTISNVQLIPLED